MDQHLDVILTALYERRNRLIQLDMSKSIQERSVESLRSRINACTNAIHDLKKGLPK